MKDSTIRYRLYEAALETGLTSSQYHVLMNEGVLDWVKDALASVSAGKEMAGDLKRMFADKKNQVIYQKATQEIQKSVAELFKAGSAAGVDKGQLKDWLLAGINKMTETAAEAAPAADEKAKEAGEPKPGTPVDSSKPETAVPMLAAAAAQAAGQDEEKAKEQATEKKVDVPKATQVLSKAISATSKVDAGKVSKIIDFLIQNKHMVAESRRVMSVDLLAAAKEASRKSGQSLVMERWNSLAGLNLLKEEAPKADEAKKKQFGDLLDDVRKKFKPEELSDDDIINVLVALDDLDSIQIK